MQFVKFVIFYDAFLRVFPETNLDPDMNLKFGMTGKASRVRIQNKSFRIHNFAFLKSCQPVNLCRYIIFGLVSFLYTRVVEDHKIHREYSFNT
jgi:hypothetical protein